MTDGFKARKIWIFSFRYVLSCHNIIYLNGLILRVLLLNFIELTLPVIFKMYEYEQLYMFTNYFNKY